MYAVAEHLDELNRKGKVKKFSSNENGYARILKIKDGCSLWFHHCLNDTLTIDIVITPVAEERYTETCTTAINRFKEFFKGKVESYVWQHSTKDRSQDKKLYVDVTEKSLQEILSTVDILKKRFA